MVAQDIMRDTRRVVFTIVRVAIGLFFIPHAYQKFVTEGIDKIAQGWAASGKVPFPTFSAWFCAISELVGGVFLIIGFAVPIAALFLIITMFGAIFTFHISHGFYALDGGWEMPALVIVVLLAVAVADYGPYALDYLVLKVFSRDRKTNQKK